MISKIISKGFKGFTGEQEIAERTLFVGPNGAGKTARSQALQLAVNGYVIGGCGKTNDDVLSAFGEGDSLSVGVEIDGKSTFARKLSRAADGKVSQKYYADNAPVSKDLFMRSLGEAGAPVILNVADFMDLSDNKKLETLFSLYPPAGDAAAIQGKINGTKEKINSLAQKIKTTEQAAARIAASKTDIKVPAGTLPEVDAEIKKLEGRLATARNELVEIKLAEQKAADELKAKEEAERKEKERLEAEARLKAEDEAKKAEPPPITDEQVLDSLASKPGPLTQEIDQRFGPEGTGTARLSPTTIAAQVTDALCSHDARLSIQAIITAIESAGCVACAARLVAKRELKKYMGVAP